MGRYKVLLLRVGISLVAACVFLPFAYSTVSAASVQDLHIQQAQHALLVSSKPAADAELQSPPPSVQMWFSEPLVPETSTSLVVDTTNHEVDTKDSHVNANNDEEMDLDLPLLPSGTYVVVWQTQSAVDGHVARGSFLFRIVRPDGSIPPIPPVLPTGHLPGSGVGVQSDNSLDGPTLLQTVAIWIALLLFTFWAGGIIWETCVFPTQKTSSGQLTAIQQASQQRIRYMPYVLAGILIANVGIIAGQAAELAGGWSGSVAWPLLHAILFESRFGIFWWLREAATLTALFFTAGQIYIQQHRQNSAKTRLTEKSAPTGGIVPSAYPIEAALLRGDLAFMHVLSDIPHLPGQLMEGIRQRTWYEHIEGILAIILLSAFALSGHAAASVSSSAVWEVIGVDMLHLLTDAVWIGGLLYIGVVLLPTLNKRSSYEWANILAIGLPRFSVIAVVSVILLATTGSFNATEHLTAYQQLWTTTYGRTLTVKILVFLCMVGISTYHAFFLRPRLAYALVETKSLQEDVISVGTGQAQGTRPAQGMIPMREGPIMETNPPDPRNESSLIHEETISSTALLLGKRLEQWLRLEGILGSAVLLCVALLAAFAGSLTASTSSTIASQPAGPVALTQTARGETITLKVIPATIGTNTFVVIVKNAQGEPETAAGVEITTTMLDMDMGTDTTQLQADPKQPGVYSQQADLTMAGHWEVDVRILPATSNTFIKATFDFSASLF